VSTAGQRGRDDTLDLALIKRLKELILQKEYRGYLDALNLALAEVRIEECGESLVPLPGALDPRISFSLVELNVPVAAEERLLLRVSVAEMLNAAQRALPAPYRLVVRDAFRSAAMVWRLHHDYVERMKEADPALDDETADIKVRNFLAMPDDPVPPGHMTGAALDVVLAGEDGELLPMKGDASMFSREELMATFNPDLPPAIQQLRQVLYDAMTGVGFHNYSREYWHYSYGDAYWAVRRQEKLAIYGIPPSTR